MSFDPEVALTDIPEFTRRTKDHRHLPARPHLHSAYNQSADAIPVDLYDSKLEFSAVIDTKFDQSPSPDVTPANITQQQATLTLYPDTTYEGYEHMPDYLKLFQDRSDIDPAKVAHAKNVLQALASKLNAGEVLDDRLGIHLDIPIDPHEEDPIVAIAKLKSQIETIATQYQNGGNPLGDIAVPKWKVKATPGYAEEQRVDSFAEQFMFDDPEAEDREMRKRVKQRTDSIKTIAVTHFQTGKFTTGQDHDAFKAAILDSLEITPEQFANPAQTGMRQIHVSMARFKAEQILGIANNTFPVGQSVTRAGRMVYDKEIDRIFPNTKGQGYA